MKKFTLLITLLLAYQTSISQCTANATNFGNNTTIPMYNVNGDISVTLNTNNTITLNLGSNFSTSPGPDVRVYLVNSNGASDTVLRNTAIGNLEHIHFGLTTANGAQSFTTEIPDGIDISSFDKVFFYCLRFDAFWDFGSFTSFSSSNCSSILSISDNTLNNISIYPNPVKSRIKISGRISNLESINIYNALGKTVYIQKDNLDSDINVSNLTSGLYIMTIKTPERIVSKRFIKQ